MYLQEQKSLKKGNLPPSGVSDQSWGGGPRKVFIFNYKLNDFLVILLYFRDASKVLLSEIATTGLL